jgi:hypothetical protein
MDQFWLLSVAGMLGCAQMVIGGVLGLCVLARKPSLD